MMGILVVGLAPVVALVVYFYHKDKYEKEPLELLLKAFLGGMFIVFLALVIESLLAIVLVRPVSSFIFRIFLSAFLVAGLVEESLKFFVFKRLIYPNKEFNEPYDGILYSVMISLGFASLENLAYISASYFQVGFLGLFGMGLTRAIFAVPAHAFFGVIMGYYFGLAKFTENKTQENRLIYRGLGLAILAHSLYDFFLFTRTYLGVGFMILLFVYCWIMAQKAVKSQLEKSPFKDNEDRGV